MKKIITSLLACAGLLAGATQSFAQCSPDNNVTETGITPTTLPPVCENISYDETLTFAVENSINGMSLDSIEVNSVSGLPDGLDFECGSGGEKCTTYPDAQKGFAINCIRIYGTPSTATTDQEITISATLYGNGGTIFIPYSESITITVYPSSNGACVINSVEGQVEEANIISAHIYDLTGNEVLESSGKSYKEKMTELPSGIYILRKEMEDGTIETERVFQQ